MPGTGGGKGGGSASDVAKAIFLSTIASAAPVKNASAKSSVFKICFRSSDGK